MSIQGAQVLIVATHGFEQSELFVPRAQLRAAGANVAVASLQREPLRAWQRNEWGESCEVDLSISEVNVEDYAALVLPGGQINPDLLRVEADVIHLIKQFNLARKPIAAICHAPWLLIEADLVRGRRATSYKSIITDMKNAGAEWVDEPTVRDDNIITARKPDDLETFIETIKQAITKQN